MEIAGRYLSERPMRWAFNLSSFVSVGNALQAFPRLLVGVAHIAAQLPQPVIVQYGHTPFDNVACQRVDFLDMKEFVEHIHRADLLIMHAGAGSIMHAIEAGKIPVVMPRRADLGEHINDHQLELAQALVEMDKIVIAHNADDLIHAVKLAVAKQRTLLKKPTIPPLLVSLVANILDDYARQSPSENR